MIGRNVYHLYLDKFCQKGKNVRAKSSVIFAYHFLYLDKFQSRCHKNVREILGDFSYHFRNISPSFCLLYRQKEIYITMIWSKCQQCQRNLFVISPIILSHFPIIVIIGTKRYHRDHMTKLHKLVYDHDSVLHTLSLLFPLLPI